MAEIKINWPFGGLNKNQSFTGQAPDTSRDLLNCRGIDPLTGRLRGAQRSGLQCLGLTGAQMCTNLLADPETFNTAGAWIVSGSGQAAAAVSPVQANPFGETTPKPAILLSSNGTAPSSVYRQAPAAPDNTFAAQQILSMFVKRPTTGSNQSNDIEIAYTPGAPYGGGIYRNVFTIAASGVVTLTSLNPDSSIDFTITGGVESVGNGWYRIWNACATAQTTVTRALDIYIHRGGGVAEEVWAWGAELCEGQLTLTPYRSGAISAGEKVQWIEPIVVDDRKITWAKENPGVSTTTTNGQYGVPYAGVAAGGDMRYESFSGRIFQQLSANRIAEYDKTGNLLDTITVPNPPQGANTTEITQFDVDTQGNLFAAVGVRTGSVAGAGGTIGGGAPPNADADGNSMSRFYRFARDISGNWEIVWTIYDTVSWVTALAVKNGRLYVGRYVPHATNPDQGAAAVSVYTGIYGSTPSQTPQISQTISGAVIDLRIHGIDVNANGIILVTGANLALTRSETYTIDDNTGTAVGSTIDDIGMGLGCKFDTDSAFYTVGFDTVQLSDIRRFTLASTGVMTSAWSVAPSSSSILGQVYQSRIDVDKFHNVWVAMERTGGTGIAVEGFSSAAGVSVAAFSETASGANGGFSVQVDTDIPDYRDTTTLWPEFVYASSHYIFKLKFATGTLTSGSPRTQKNVVVAGGLIKTFTIDDWTTSPPTVTVMTPNNTSSGAMQTKDFIQAATLFNKVFFVDGMSYRVYDPKNIENSEDGEVTNYEATQGIIPPRCKLISSWRGRIVLARGDNEQEYFMSAQGDPFDYLFYPPVASATQAIQGSIARAGLMPDVTNGIIPYTDDLLIMGGDHSMWRFTGDPAAGGQIDLISDITGMSFGKAWCKDPDGIIYFFGSRGGVYRMSPESMPERITYGSIERDLQDLDLSANYIRLIWNYRDEGLHVFQMPYGAVTAQLDHWFWEQKSGGWYKDNFYDTTAVSNQPTAAAVIDGDDPNDRRLLLGGGGNTALSSGDGYVAAWDADTFTDTGTAIYSKALIGPFQADDKEVRMTSFSPVLASDQSGANYRLYVTPTADTLHGQVFNGTMQAGRNPRLRMRGRGSHIFLEISDASINRWAFETATVEVYPAGRQRVRAV